MLPTYADTNGHVPCTERIDGPIRKNNSSGGCVWKKLGRLAASQQILLATTKFQAALGNMTGTEEAKTSVNTRAPTHALAVARPRRPTDRK